MPQCSRQVRLAGAAGTDQDKILSLLKILSFHQFLTQMAC